MKSKNMTSIPLDSTRFRQPLVRRFAIPQTVRGAIAVLVAAGLVTLTGSLFAGPIQAAENPPAATPVAAVPAGPILIAPATVSLNHVRQPQSLQVLGQTADGFSLDLRSQAQFRSADPKVATVDGQGWVQPVATGQTQISIEVAGQSLAVPVSVTLSDAVPLFSFRHEVMPVVSKAACNSGACHGYSLGKNGFKLSLRGADPAQDFLAITKEQFGRRLNLQFPQESLVLAKPNGTTPHEGGIRFKAGSLSNELLLAWIRQGAPGDLADTRAVASVRLVPDRLVLLPGQKHQLQMIATYTDGSQRDVTRLGIFSANNTQFADVTEEGLVTAGDAGETAIVGRFERTFTAASILVLQPDSAFVSTPVPQDHLIDRPVVEKLNRLKITPSPLAGDEEFLRRVYLDLIGLQPKPEEIRAFLAETATQKRAAVVDSLFARPEFVDHWSLKWGDLLQNSRNVVSQPSVYMFREFLRGAVAENLPLDEFVRRILKSRGGIVDDPASVYFALSKDTNDTVERATQVFCGVRMLCARCHTHPLENWTQADYYGLASFFTQVSTRPDTRYPQAPNTKIVQVTPTAGFAIHPRTGQPQPPHFLGGNEPTIPAGADRREAYANWLTSADNPFFARGMVNRIWSYFFHRGIIEPVDDVRSTNPPINPALLDALTRDFIDNQFDVRHLMRMIVLSDTYQRTSVATESNRRDQQNFSRAIPRRVPAEALLDSLIQATGVNENFGGVPGGFRAAQLPDGTVDNQFLSLFGKPQRMDACECERDRNSNMLQALHFLGTSGSSIGSRVTNPNARPAVLVNQKLNDEQLATELHLWSIARHPRPDEAAVVIEYLKANPDKRLEATQDIMWSLLNSRGFLLVD